MTQPKDAPKDAVLLSLVVVAKCGYLEIIHLHPQLSDLDRKMTVESLRDFAERLEKGKT